MMITIRYYSPGEEIADAFWVRDQVFTIEQQFSPEIEIDEFDKQAYHLVMYQEDKPFATARTFPKSLETKDSADDTTYIIGRVCILPHRRGNGTGLQLMELIEKVAIDLGATQLELGAQCTAAAFYEKRGFVQTEETYMEEHCRHVIMRKSIEA